MRLQLKTYPLVFLICILSLIQVYNVHLAHSQNLEQETFDIPFTRTDILRAQEVAEKIRKLYSENKYYYIFIGRSLTLVRALMDLKGVPNTGLPFSGKSIDLTFSSPFGRQLRPILINHLNQYLPSPHQYKNKQLVLVDFTASGHGLETARKTLDWYFQGQQPLHLLRVSTHGSFLFSFMGRLLGRAMDKTITIHEDSMLTKHYYYSNFDSYAGYGSFSVENGIYRDFNKDNKARFEALKHWIVSIKPSVFPDMTHISCQSYLNLD